MSANEIHVGDIGTVFEFTVKDGAVAVDISTATTKEVKLDKPDNTTVTKAVTFKTTGVDGVVRWASALATDLDQAGEWVAQVHIVMPTGEWRSDWYTFRVYPNL